LTRFYGINCIELLERRPNQFLALDAAEAGLRAREELRANGPAAYEDPSDVYDLAMAAYGSDETAQRLSVACMRSKYQRPA
jgi:hypothetical protein